MTQIPQEVVQAFDRLRAVTMESLSASEVINEIDAVERIVSLALGGTSPENRPVIPAKDERWG